jgi:hypothetical protein
MDVLAEIVDSFNELLAEWRDIEREGILHKGVAEAALDRKDDTLPACGYFVVTLWNEPRGLVDLVNRASAPIMCSNRMRIAVLKKLSRSGLSESFSACCAP